MSRSVFYIHVCGWRCKCIDHACLCVDGGVDVSTMHVCVWMAV